MEKLEVLYVAKQANDYTVRYSKNDVNGTYFSESNEVIVHDLGGPRVFKLSGEYGEEFVTALIAELNSVELSPDINREEMISIIQCKLTEAKEVTN